MKRSDRRVVVMDTEFTPRIDGQDVICVCFVELNAKGKPNKKHSWKVGEPVDKLREALGEDATIVAYNVQAEATSLIELGIDPTQFDWIDLMIQFFQLKEDGQLHAKGARTMQAALKHYKLYEFVDAEKSEWQDLAIEGGPFSEEELAGLVKYCFGDVRATVALYNSMKPKSVNILQGNFMAAQSLLESRGIPFDSKGYELYRNDLPNWYMRRVERVDPDYQIWTLKTDKKTGVTKPSLTDKKFEAWVKSLGREIYDRWPRTSRSHKLSKSVKDLREIGKIYPSAQPVIRTLDSLGRLRALDLPYVSDKHYPRLSKYGTKTGRIKNSSTGYILALAKYLRAFIRCPEDKGIAYVDYHSQEIAVQATLSCDANMLRAYESDDIYLDIGKQLGLITDPNPTKETHGEERKLAKALTLGLSYGKGANALADDLRCDTTKAAYLMKKHEESFSTYYIWREREVETGYTNARMTIDRRLPNKVIRGDWSMDIPSGYNDIRKNTLRNWPIQSTAGMILRVATILAAERGIEVCASYHDSFMLCCDLDDFERQRSELVKTMEDAAELVIGYRIPAEVEKSLKPGERFVKRGEGDSKDENETIDLLLDLIGD